MRVHLCLSKLQRKREGGAAGRDSITETRRRADTRKLVDRVWRRGQMKEQYKRFEATDAAHEAR